MTETIEEALRQELRAGISGDPSPAIAERAEGEGLLDVGVGTLDSPFGGLLVAATPEGVVRLAFAEEDEDAVLAEIAERISPRILRAPRRVDPARRQLAEYFAGARRAFDLRIDMRLTTPFRRQVLGACARVPFGETSTYARLAQEAGRPRAVRAAGTALAKNPVPVIVPCHRVLRSDGGVGGYRGGTDAKALLLAHERESGAASAGGPR